MYVILCTLYPERHILYLRKWESDSGGNQIEVGIRYENPSTGPFDQDTVVRSVIKPVCSELPSNHMEASSFFTFLFCTLSSGSLNSVFYRVPDRQSGAGPT